MKDKIERVLNVHQKKLIILAMLVMTVFGYAVSGNYGTPLDEDIEISILVSNIKEYAMHIPGKLGDRLENKFSYVVPISQSEEKDHGIAAYYPYALLHVIADDHRVQRTLWHAYTFMIFMAGVIAVYGIVKTVFGSRRHALFASLMLYLSPRMFAEGHYNNKDMVVMSFVLITIYFGIKMIQTRKILFAVLFAIAAAVASNTKIAGAWFFGIIGISYLIYLIKKKELKRHNVMVGVCAIIVFFACYVLITPAMWAAPAEFVRLLLMYAQDFDRWDNNILFEGQIYKYSVNPPPKYYLLKMIFITTPVYILLLNAAGIVFTVVNCFKSKFRDKQTVIMAINLLLWIFPLSFAVISQTRVYNGWRHFYFIYGPFIITASYAAYCITDILRNRFAKGLRAAAAAGGIIVILSVLVIVSNPCQYAYFNIFAGADAENNYETDYWMVSTKLTLKRLYKQTKGSRIAIAGSDRMTANSLKKALKVLPETYASAFDICDISDAQYLLVNRYGPVLYDENIEWQWEGRLKEISTVSYGREIAAVYKMYSD